ncbi:hypothetical protein BDV98DRAFT_572079 [Pterulicium gracile]|uniref:Uncharacterized protein n=1 Tax=Pterulicium gracile TaxID=1884261 RepID=A0A5C3QBR5_9AGAR|nr:hypothetical protein BDV98DRAFT_572079 [Pterula gracilis]
MNCFASFVQRIQCGHLPSTPQYPCCNLLQCPILRSTRLEPVTLQLLETPLLSGWRISQEMLQEVKGPTEPRSTMVVAPTTRPKPNMGLHEPSLRILPRWLMRRKGEFSKAFCAVSPPGITTRTNAVYSGRCVSVDILPGHNYPSLNESNGQWKTDVYTGRIVSGHAFSSSTTSPQLRPSVGSLNHRVGEVEELCYNYRF